MKKYGFVYETTNKVNGMKYIGKCIYSRKNNWETYLGSGVYLKRAIKKYGKSNFERIILAEADSEEELNELEEYYIKKYNAVESPNYYNVKYTSIGARRYRQAKPAPIFRPQARGRYPMWNAGQCRCRRVPLRAPLHWNWFATGRTGAR